MPSACSTGIEDSEFAIPGVHGRRHRRDRRPLQRARRRIGHAWRIEALTDQQRLTRPATALPSTSAISASVKAGTSSGLRLVTILAVGHRGLVDDLAPAFRRSVRIERPAGRLAPAQQVGLDQQPRPVADRRDRLARCGEGADQIDHPCSVRSAVGIADPAGQDQRVIIVHRRPRRSSGRADGLARIVVDRRLDRVACRATPASPARPCPRRISLGPNSSDSSNRSVAMIRIAALSIAGMTAFLVLRGTCRRQRAYERRCFPGRRVI